MANPLGCKSTMSWMVNFHGQMRRPVTTKALLGRHTGYSTLYELYTNYIIRTFKHTHIILKHVCVCVQLHAWIYTHTYITFNTYLCIKLWNKQTKPPCTWRRTKIQCLSLRESPDRAAVTHEVQQAARQGRCKTPQVLYRFMGPQERWVSWFISRNSMVNW